MDELKPHQRTAASKLANGKILVGGVGTGKSRTALQYYIEQEAHRDVYIITTAKKRDSLDWVAEGAAMGLGRAGATVAGAMTVDSWNRIAEYTEIEGAFFIFDEQRLVGSGAWVKAFYKIAKQNRWILLSATPGDTWMDYIPVFVANGFYKNKTEFVSEHVIYKPYTKYQSVQGYRRVGVLVRHRNKLLVEMPFDRHTVRHERVIKVSYDRELFQRVWKHRWHVYENRPLRDIGEAYIVMRKVLNTDPSRMEALRELRKEFPRVIVFYNFDYELEIIRAGLDKDGVVYSEWNGHKHESIPDTDNWVYLVQFTAGAEGWNCITTNVVCFYSLPYSYRLYEQAYGRIDRMNTTYVPLFCATFDSGAWLDTQIRKKLKEKKSFNLGGTGHV